MPVEAGFDQGGEPPATAMAAFKGCLANFETKEGRLKGLAFQPKAGDVMVREHAFGIFRAAVADRFNVHTYT